MTIATVRRVTALAFLCACGRAPTAPTTATRSFALPGAPPGVTVDFIGYEHAHDRVWVPVGETGSVDVFDVKSRSFARVDGFKTHERESHGRKRMMGPSSVTFGEGVAYVGDRASDEVCAIDESTLKVGACVTLQSAPDGVSWVASTKEVWVTTPKDASITILDATAPDLRQKAVVTTGGETEAYAVDARHGVFYTNLEDKKVTLGFDITTRALKTTWPLACSDGPRGVVADGAHDFVYVACTDGIEALDAAHDGHVVASLDTGEGVDIVDFAPETQSLYVAAGKASRLTIARVDDVGHMVVTKTIETAPGVRNAVVDAGGTIYAVDPTHSTLVMFDAR